MGSDDHRKPVRKVAIVMGAAGDMGDAIVRFFASESARIMATDYAPGDWANAFADIADRVTCRLRNVSRRDERARVVAETDGRLDVPVTVLVDNAGISGCGMPLMEETEDLFQTIVATNLGGVYDVIKAVVPTGVTKTTAAELGVNGIRVNNVRPGHRHVPQRRAFQAFSPGDECPHQVGDSTERYGSHPFRREAKQQLRTIARQTP